MTKDRAPAERQRQRQNDATASSHTCTSLTQHEAKRTGTRARNTKQESRRSTQTVALGPFAFFHRSIVVLAHPLLPLPGPTYIILLFLAKQTGWLIILQTHISSQHPTHIHTRSRANRARHPLNPSLTPTSYPLPLPPSRRRRRRLHRSRWRPLPLSPLPHRRQRRARRRGDEEAARVPPELRLQEGLAVAGVACVCWCIYVFR